MAVEAPASAAGGDIEASMSCDEAEANRSTWSAKADGDTVDVVGKELPKEVRREVAPLYELMLASVTTY